MFKKILIAEDIDSINEGNKNFFETQLKDSKIEEVQYCDDAYIKIQKAILEEDPYDLLITDLSFKKDYREEKLRSGTELIAKIREKYFDIKIIAYSIEDRTSKIRQLFNEHNIDGYVCKGRNGLKDLIYCIQEVAKGEKYLSPEVQHALTGKSITELEDYDISLVKHLSDGMTQEQIGAFFKENNIKPYSKSSIEKRLNKLKITFKAKNVIHLVAIIKDLGLI